MADGATLVRTDTPDTLRCSVGAYPTRPTITARYRARMVAVSGNVVYMSRQGVEDDWDYSGNGAEVGQALAISLESICGTFDEITAVVPVRDRFMYLSTGSSLWILEGDPVDGRLQRISDNVGVLTKSSWALNETVLFFLSADGVYTVEANELKRWSRERLPGELANIDLNTYTPCVGFDKDLGCFFVFLKGSSTHYAFNQKHSSIWPFTLLDWHVPDAIATIRSDGKMPRMAMLGDDSVWRVFAKDATLDDGAEPVQSHVVLGPFRVAGDFLDGFLSEISCSITEASGNVLLEVWTEHECEACLRAARTKKANFTYTIRPGWNRVIRPRVRGEWACIKLSASAPWAFENLSVKAITTGN